MPDESQAPGTGRHGAVMALISASLQVRGGGWVHGAPTHVFGELLAELEVRGWHLIRDVSATERAELEVARDTLQRLIGFDGGPELMSWQDRHCLHAEEPYIGCPFCRDQFVLRAEATA